MREEEIYGLSRGLHKGRRLYSALSVLCPNPPVLFCRLRRQLQHAIQQMLHSPDKRCHRRFGQHIIQSSVLKFIT